MSVNVDVVTFAQRGEAFIVRIDDDADLGLARVYDSVLARLHPRLPLEEIVAASVRVPGSLPGAALTEPEGRWTEPSRRVTAEEIASAERVENVP